MPSTPPLLIDLAGVARLADVQRPVASVWRSRYASGADPFPEAVSSDRGRPLFDVVSIAEWLARTGRGNNRDVVADAAASATPPGFDFSDPAHVAAVDALLTVHAASGEMVGDLAPDELAARAAAVDPDDTCLVSEVREVVAGWAEWADLLADAAYSPAQASRLLERGHEATRSATGASGPLAPNAEALVVELASALMVDRRGELAIHDGIAASLAGELVARAGDDVDVVVPPGRDGRSVRRRRLLDESDLPLTASAAEVARLHVARFPSTTATTTRDVLDSVDEMVLGMRADDRALVLAPAAILIDELAPADGLVRTDVLRSGRMRAIVRLPTGLITAAPRAALVLWVFGPEADEGVMADRFTAVADLTGARLTSAARADLTGDVLAALGSVRAVRSHSFRFARLVRTTSLLAARAGLIPVGVFDRADGIAHRSPRDLPALLDLAYAALGDDAPHTAPDAASGPAIPASSIEQLLEQRHVRLSAGTRLDAGELSDTGLVVVGVKELDDPSRIGGRRVDQLAFAALHPSARLTRPGDVVFRTAPSPRAWVDHDGSKVVDYPARVLRIDTADPGGLVPELVVSDIERSSGGPAAWRRWRLRRVAPSVAPSLQAALSDLSARREALTRRLAALDRYRDLLVSGVASGVVSLVDDAPTESAPTDRAADAATNPQ